MRKLLFDGPVTVGYDAFTDVNGTNVTAHAMDLGPGWTKFGPGTGVIQGNRARLTGVASAGTYFTGDYGRTNFVLSTVIQYVNSTDGGLIFRWQDSGNHWVFDFNHNAQKVQIWEAAAGVSVLRAAAAHTIGLAADYLLKVICRGQNIQCWVNGVVALTYDTPVLATTTSRGIFVGGAAGGGPNVDFDNFRVEALDI